MQKLNGINMVIASGSETVQNCLREAFLKRGAEVVLCGFLNRDFVNKLEYEDAVDVILIDMDDSYEEDDDALDRLIERIDLPLLFHDNDFDDINDPEQGCGFSQQGIDKLAYKLSKLVENNGTTREVSKPPDIEQLTIDDELQENDPDDLVLIADDSPDSFFVDKSGIVELEEQMQSVAQALSTENSQSDEDSLLAEGSLLAEDSLPAEGSLPVEESLPVKDALPAEDALTSEGFLAAEGSLPVEDVIPIEDSGSSLIEEVISVHESLSENVPVEHSVNDNVDYAVNVWILGASIGGPESVKRFLARLPAELPVGFILAQHLGEGFVSLLAEQLDRESRFKVKEAKSGDTLRHGEVLVAPVENRMTLDSKGRVGFSEEGWKGHYKPSIDDVIQDVSNSYGCRSGIIIFSGMGADGVLACQEFAERYQGNIWAQTTDTCVISSMPDSVRKANLVSFSGSPEVLAMKISKLYMDKE